VIVLRFKNYINGKWVDSASKQTIKDINPANKNEVVCVVPKSNAKDVDLAVKAAKKAFPKWKATPAPKRGELLFEASRLLAEQKDDIAKLMCREMGKVLQECLGDVQEGVDLGYYMAGEGRRLHGETVPSELNGKHMRTVREPVGVFALVTPWNFPIAIPAWKLFPALVSGNTVVFKPSSYVPASATKLVQIFEKAGVPPGVLNLVHGSGSEAGNALITHPGVNGVSFTGSTAVGRKIGEHCGKNLMKHSLEMGGKNVIIVMDDANLDLAVDGCVWGGFGTAGQRCTASSRVIVHQKVYGQFKKKFVARVKKLRLGNGLDNNTDVGPLINESQVKKAEQYMHLARKSKLKILCGGKRASGKLKNGFFFEPTIIDNPPRSHAVSCEEIFGPVVAMIKAKHFEDAIAVANNVEYGLSSAIFTQDVNLAHRAADMLETGLVYINSATIGAEIQTPFGGVKGTGNGHREAGGVGGALETYTEMKVINTDYSGSLQKAQGIKWK
jgi:alpha-ketoglutaric semialdehyde dehydrogenase